MAQRKTKKAKYAKGKQQLKAALLTPYLYEDIGDFTGGCGKCEGCQSKIKKQVEKYGFDPDNFKKTGKLLTKKGREVLLETPSRHTLPDPRLADLAFAGSTKSGEEEVRTMRGSGLIVARYSTFYGSTSGYTGRKPEESGYALDIPKKIEAIRAILTDDRTIDALLERKEQKIIKAIGKLNNGIERPVLITPYLPQALTYSRDFAKDKGNSSDSLTVRVAMGQVKEGREYSGIIAFGKSEFDYDLRLGLDIIGLAELGKANPSEARKQVYLQIKKVGSKGELMLSEEDKSIFLGTLIAAAADLYSQPERKITQDIIEAAQRTPGLKEFAGNFSMTFGMQTSYKIPLTGRTKELVKRLEGYKE